MPTFVSITLICPDTRPEKNIQRMKITKSFFLGTVLLLSVAPATAQLEKRIACFPVGDVRLTESPFKHAQEMAPYRKEAGLTPKAPNYGNWENSGLDGHIGGHYLSALSYMYAATGDTEIKARLDYMLDELQTCQEAAGDGYLCGVPGGISMTSPYRSGNTLPAISMDTSPSRKK